MKYHYLYLNIYTVIEGLTIIYVFFKELKPRNPYPMIFLGAAFFFLSLSALTNTMYSYVIYGTSSVTIATLSVINLFKLSGDVTIPKLTDYYFFWLNFAFLFNFSVTCIPFIFVDYIRLSDPVTQQSLWSIHLVANIIYNILLFVGILKSRRAYRQLLSTRSLASE